MARKNSTISNSSDVIELTPNEGAELIVGIYNSGNFDRTLLFRGSPGIGKTSFVRQAADKLRETDPDFHYIEVNPTMPADEVGGIPDLIRETGKATVTDYAMPKWYPTAEANPNWRGIICLDDALQGDKMMQQTLANLIQARTLRNHPLPKGAMIIATGNRIEDNAGVTRMLSHLADRLTVLNVAADAETWISNYALPNGVDERIIAYIQQHPDKLNKFDPKLEKCATPRTWAAVNTRMAYIDSLKDRDDGTHAKFAQALLAGELGMGEATVFWAFCTQWGRLPDTDAILIDPDKVSSDIDIDLQYATTMALAKKMGPDNMLNALSYIKRLSPDLTAMAVKIGATTKPELKNSAAFVQWAVDNQEFIHGFA